MQLGDNGRLCPAELAAQQFAEEVVVAIPTPLLVQRDNREAVALEGFERRIRAFLSHDGVAQVTAKPAEHRRVQQERPELGCLRDVHGYTGADVARELDLTEGNQRVLLHRGRGSIRAAVEEYLTAS